MSEQVNKTYSCDICQCLFKSQRLLTWHLSQCKVQTSALPFKFSYCNAPFHHQKGLLIHLNSRHPGKTESHDTQTPNIAINSVEKNDKNPLLHLVNNAMIIVIFMIMQMKVYVQLC
jgi:hypothetical protein